MIAPPHPCRVKGAHRCPSHSACCPLCPAYNRSPACYKVNQCMACQGIHPYNVGCHLPAQLHRMSAMRASCGRCADPYIRAQLSHGPMLVHCAYSRCHAMPANIDVASMALQTGLSGSIMGAPCAPYLCATCWAPEHGSQPWHRD